MSSTSKRVRFRGRFVCWISGFPKRFADLVSALKRKEKCRLWFFKLQLSLIFSRPIYVWGVFITSNKSFSCISQINPLFQIFPVKIPARHRVEVAVMVQQKSNAQSGNQADGYAARLIGQRRICEVRRFWSLLRCSRNPNAAALVLTNQSAPSPDR